MTETETETAPAPGRWRGLIVLLTLSHLVGTVGYVSVMAMAPLIRADLDLNATQIGSFMSAFYFALAVIAIPGGVWVDRAGVGKALMLSMALLAAGAAGFATVGSYPPAVLATFVMGLGYGLVNPATAKGVLDGFRPQERATAMGVKQMGVPVGGLAAAGLAAGAATLSWRGVLFGIAAATVVLGVAWWLRGGRGRRPTAQPKGGSLANLRAVLKNRDLTALNVAGFFFNGAQQSVATYLTLFLRDAALATQPLASLCLGVAQASGASGRVLWAVASDRLAGGRRKGALVLMMSIAAAAGLIAALVGPGWPAFVLIGLAAATGATVLAYAPMMHTACAEAAEPGQAGAAIGANLLATAVGGAICPLLFGALVDATGGYGAAWTAAAVILALGVAAIAFGLREGAARRT